MSNVGPHRTWEDVVWNDVAEGEGGEGRSIGGLL